MDRRTFLRGALVGAGASVLSGSLWSAAVAAGPAQPGLGPYGPPLFADRNGIRLPLGFTSRVVARSGHVVPGSAYTWHAAPDGGACFADGAGWIYVSNSEVTHAGGAGALRFDSRGAVTDAYRILPRSNHNCSGGATPWRTWLSCEEVPRGYVWETDPRGERAAVRRPAMGRFKHEAAAVDPVRRCVYLTEDEPDGCLYRFLPTHWPNLSRGRLEVLCGRRTTGHVTWAKVPDPDGSPTATRRQVAGAKRFNGGEGAVYGGGLLHFSTKGDNRIWRLDPATNTLGLAYDDSLVDGPTPLFGADALARGVAGDLFVAEDGGNMEICLVTPAGVVASFLQVLGQAASELTGVAFSPNGRRLYFSSQRGTDGAGITYEVRGPFRG